jgi:hypothetical protein
MLHVSVGMVIIGLVITNNNTFWGRLIVVINVPQSLCFANREPRFNYCK